MPIGCLLGCVALTWAGTDIQAADRSGPDAESIATDERERLDREPLDDAAERFPQIDAGILHLGRTRILMRTVTMDDRQGVDAVNRIHPRRIVPVHHDDYGVLRSPVSAFLPAADRHGFWARVLAAERGETIPLFKAGHTDWRGESAGRSDP